MLVSSRTPKAGQAIRLKALAAPLGTSVPAARRAGTSAARVIWPPTHTVAPRTCRNRRMVSRSIAFTAAACQRAGPAPSAGCPRRQQRQPAGRAAAGQLEQRVHLQVLLHEVGQQLEPTLAGGREADPRRPPRQAPQPGHLGEERRTERVALQAAVPHGAEHRLVPGSAEELLGVGPAGDPPVVDLVCRLLLEKKKPA